MLIPTEEGLVPEAGMTLAALEAGSAIKPIILGKPMVYFFEIAVGRLKKSKSMDLDQVVMLGDRLDTDIKGALDYGIKSILVITGVDDNMGIEKKGIYPDLVIEDLDELKSIWIRSKDDGK